ncbi:unnamed protein product [Pleuronectes platessa]|uniref:Uncharacterized protein n=1 Tax=Pleuronectes platessa TaxID=8262 RepID=A0A9N7TMW8_PLEPL|nr:unnamed protein product [Pleuronectes platessa]
MYNLTMSPNASVPLHILKSSEDDHRTTVDMDTIMDTVTVVLYTLTVVLGITGQLRGHLGGWIQAQAERHERVAGEPGDSRPDLLRHSLLLPHQEVIL